MFTVPITLPVRVSLATPLAWLNPLVVTAPAPESVNVMAALSEVTVFVYASSIVAVAVHVLWYWIPPVQELPDLLMLRANWLAGPGPVSWEQIARRLVKGRRGREELIVRGHEAPEGAARYVDDTVGGREVVTTRQRAARSG